MSYVSVSRWLPCVTGAAGLPCAQDQIDDEIDVLAMLDLREDGRSSFPDDDIRCQLKP